MKLETPPIGVQLILDGVKFAFEKVGIDGEMHPTDIYGAFEPIDDPSDIYGDGTGVTLLELERHQGEAGGAYMCDMRVGGRLQCSGQLV